MSHIPVLLAEILKFVDPQPDQLIIDATFGAGGYAHAFLEKGARVIAFDRDPAAIAAGRALEKASQGKLHLIHAPFSQMQEHIAEQVDAIVFDLGVSSMQLDEAPRGFSFRKDGPLDMRMSGEGQSAADLVNTLSEEELADVLYLYGEERKSRAIAKAIVRHREEKLFTRTLDLAALVEKVVTRNPKDKSHPATRTFQALRITVNSEMEEISQGLICAEKLLKPGGKLAVVTFHSLEDRLVKSFLIGKSAPSRHAPPAAKQKRTFKILTKKPVIPGKAELAANPRARSAKLRIAEKMSGYDSFNSSAHPRVSGGPKQVEE